MFSLDGSKIILLVNFLVKNNKLTQLNLSINNFTNEYGDSLRSFLSACNPDFKIILSHNKFDEKFINNLLISYEKNILF